MDQQIGVIGAGCGRTGTTSLKLALEILGYNPCYSMYEVIRDNHASFWVRVSNHEAYNFEEVFNKGTLIYKASVDVPASMYWKEQLAKYPDAKVILTRRDPEKWYKSMSDTVFKMMPSGPYSSFGVKIATYFLGTSRMFQKLIVEDFFRCDLRRENAIRCYSEHNSQVIAESPADKLLVYEAGQGWEPICTFLGKPIPDVPYPNVNDTKEFQNRVFYINIAGYALLVLASLPVISLGWYAVRGGGGMRKAVAY